MESKDKTQWVFINICDEDHWIHSIEFSNGKSTMRIPVNEVNTFIAMLNTAYINSTERCEACSGIGRVDIGDPSSYMDEHYVDCNVCKGRKRIRKNAFPRVRCTYESTETPSGVGWYCMAHCTNLKSPLNGKTCDDYLRRDCQVREPVK